MFLFIRRFLVGFIALIFFQPAYSQKKWTLQECVDHALKNNISIRQSEIVLQQSKISLTQKKLQFLPSINGSASHNYNFGRSVDPTTNQFTTEQIQSDNISVSSNITLFNGLQLQNELKQNRLDYLANSYDLKKNMNDISLSVVSSFLQVLFAQDALTASVNQRDRSLKQRDRTKALTDAGSLTQGNYLDAEAQLATDEVAVITAENNLTIALLSLAQLLELQTIDGFSVERPASEIPDISILSQTPMSIYQSAQQHLPELKSSQTRVMSAKAGLSVARGARYPRLSAFASLGTGYSSASQRLSGSQFLGLFPNGSFTTFGDTVLSPLYITNLEDTPFDDQIDQNYNRSVGFSLSIPIFNGWATEGGVKRARLNVLNTELSEDLQNQQVLKSIQQAYADATGSQKKYAAAQRSFDALQASFTYTQKKFDGGLVSSFEWLTAKNNFAKAELDLLQAKYDYIFRVKVLDFYAGKPLTL
jgi:outer membrane protein